MAKTENEFSYPKKKKDPEYLGVNCVVLFLDVVGFSKNSGTKEMRKIISTINDTIDDWITTEYYWGDKGYNDVILILTGDGFAIGYSPKLPLEKSLEDAREIFARMTEDKLFKVRIGIAKGFNVRYIDKDDRLNLFGPGINLANRVMSGAHENQILIHEDLVLELKDNEKLPKDIQRVFIPVITKHGDEVSVYNYYKKNEYGIPVPTKKKSSITKNY